MKRQAEKGKYKQQQTKVHQNHRTSPFSVHAETAPAPAVKATGSVYKLGSCLETTEDVYA